MVRSRGIGAVVAVLVCAAVVGAQVMQPERHVMVTEADKPAQKCRVLKCWKDKDGNKVCQVQAIDSGELMTIVEADVRPASGGGAVRPPQPPTKVVHWGGQKTPPAIAPSPPADALVVGQAMAPARPSMWDRVFASSRPRISTQTRVTPVPVMNPDKPAVVSARLEKPSKVKPRDPRDAWGSVERWSDADANKVADQAVAKAQAVAPRPKPPAQVAQVPPAAEKRIQPAPVAEKRVQPVQGVEKRVQPVPASPTVKLTPPAAPTQRWLTMPNPFERKPTAAVAPKAQPVAPKAQPVAPKAQPVVAPKAQAFVAPRVPPEKWTQALPANGGEVERWSDGDAEKVAQQAVARAEAIPHPVAPKPITPAPVLVKATPSIPVVRTPARVTEPRVVPIVKAPTVQLPSWGKVEFWKNEQAKKTADAAAAKAQLVQPPPAPVVKVAQATPTPPPPPEPVKDAPRPLSAVVVDTPDVVKETKPAPEKTRPEPKKVELPATTAVVDLKKPAAVEPKSDASLWARLTGVRRPADAPAVAGPDLPTSGVKGEARAWSQTTGLPQTKAAEKPVVAPTPMPAAPKAVAKTVPMMGTMGYPSIPVNARNAFTEKMAVGPTMPTMPMQMVLPDGVPDGLNNAFTMGGSPRPIPSDMNRTYYVPNGLQGGGQMGGAEMRPVFGAASYPTPPQGYYAASGYYAPPGYAATGYQAAPGYYVASGYYPVPATSAQQPRQMPSSVVRASLVMEQPTATSSMQTLRDAVMPSEREFAVDVLVRCDWRRQPEVVEALTKAARTDPAATVRAACVRALGRMKCNTMPVVSALTALKSDPDVRVRQEVEQTLPALLK